MASGTRPRSGPPMGGVGPLRRRSCRPHPRTGRMSGLRPTRSSSGLTAWSRSGAAARHSAPPSGGSRPTADAGSPCQPSLRSGRRRALATAAAFSPTARSWATASASWRYGVALTAESGPRPTVSRGGGSPLRATSRAIKRMRPSCCRVACCSPMARPTGSARQRRGSAAQAPHLPQWHMCATPAHRGRVTRRTRPRAHVAPGAEPTGGAAPPLRRSGRQVDRQRPGKSVDILHADVPSLALNGETTLVDLDHTFDVTMHLRAPFTLDAWDVVADEPTPDRGPATARVLLRKTYVGPVLVATASGHARTTFCPGGSSYVARERIVGTLNGREGTFVLEHRASMSEGHPVVMDAIVVDGSGTGALTGIVGSGHVTHEVLTLDLGLPTG